MEPDAANQEDLAALAADAGGGERPPPPGHEGAPRFVPPVSDGFVTKVYDGDTITVAVELMAKTYLFSVRVRGIDCPEMRTRDPDEKHVALLARDAVSEITLGRWVALGDVGTDKYGRLLATVHTPDGVDVSEMLIARRLAVAYEGKKKAVPANWREFHESA